MDIATYIQARRSIKQRLVADNNFFKKLSTTEKLFDQLNLAVEFLSSQENLARTKDLKLIDYMKDNASGSIWAEKMGTSAQEKFWSENEKYLHVVTKFFELLLEHKPSDVIHEMKKLQLVKTPSQMQCLLSELNSYVTQELINAFVDINNKHDISAYKINFSNAKKAKDLQVMYTQHNSYNALESHYFFNDFLAKIKSSIFALECQEDKAAVKEIFQYLYEKNLFPDFAAWLYLLNKDSPKTVKTEAPKKDTKEFFAFVISLIDALPEKAFNRIMQDISCVQEKKVQTMIKAYGVESFFMENKGIIIDELEALRVKREKNFLSSNLTTTDNNELDYKHNNTRLPGARKFKI